MRVQLGQVQEGTWSFSRARLQAGTVQKAGGILSPQDLAIPTFRFQRPTFPFGFPHASTPDPLTGDVAITYPPGLAKRLSLPLTKAQCKTEGLIHRTEPKEYVRRRKQACNEVQGQCW